MHLLLKDFSLSFEGDAMHCIPGIALDCPIVCVCVCVCVCRHHVHKCGLRWGCQCPWNVLILKITSASWKQCNRWLYPFHLSEDLSPINSVFIHELYSKYFVHLPGCKNYMLTFTTCHCFFVKIAVRLTIVCSLRPKILQFIWNKRHCLRWKGIG